MLRCLPVLALALAACTPVTPPGGAPSGSAGPIAGAAAPPPADQSLEAWHWRLAQAVDPDGNRIDALFAEPDRPLLLDFSHGRISVAGGCNRIGGGYRREGAMLRVEQLMQTRMACAQELMVQDATIVGLLDGELELAIHADAPPTLELSAADGTRLTFTGEPVADPDQGR